MFPSAPSRKRPITRSELATVTLTYGSSPSFDNSLFLAILLTGFHGLMQLGELTWPDKKSLQDYRKVVMQNLVQISKKYFQFMLPGHKADCFFKGNQVIIQSMEAANDPWSPFTHYLSLCDQSFPLHPELWLKSDGTIPMRSWFVHISTPFPRKCQWPIIASWRRNISCRSQSSFAYDSNHWPLVIRGFLHLYLPSSCSLSRHPILLAAHLCASKSNLPLNLCNCAYHHFFLSKFFLSLTLVPPSLPH